MKTENYYLVYFLIGLMYWAVNFFVRKLHRENDNHEGWFLATSWFFFWPMFFFMWILIFAKRLFVYLESKLTKY